MAYLNNAKYKEIYAAAKSGNEKAQMIIQSLRKGGMQEEIDGLVNDYYKVPIETPNMAIPAVEQEEPVCEEPVCEEQPITEPCCDNQATTVQDMFSVLDGECDGLFDENEIDDLGFCDFLKNKSRDGLRSRKNAEYFKAYSPEDRLSYMNRKVSDYKGKFDGRLKDIERRYNDANMAIGLYADGVNASLDDSIELNMEQAGKAYDDFTNDEATMKSFGRFWDENDNNAVADKLRMLIDQYGKKNVIAALNILSGDNENFRNYSNNQIDTEIGRYSKSVENLLK